MMSQLTRCRRLSFCADRIVSRCGSARLLFLVLAAGCAVPQPSAQPAATQPTRARAYDRIEAEILVALNRARTDPVGTASGIDALTKYYNGKLFQRPTQSVPIQTVEGVAAVREAAADVRSR